MLILFLTGFSCLAYSTLDRYILEHPPGPRLRVLDIGHGLSILLEGAAGQRMLIDGGGSSLSTFNVGEYTLIPLLTDNRPPRLEAVLNTHPDSDHLRGLLPILRRMDVKDFWLTRSPDKPAELLLLAETLTLRGIEPKQPRPGDKIYLDDNHYLHILYPPPDKRGSSNTLSLAARLTRTADGHGLALITGDLTKPGLRRIMKAALDNPELDIRSDVVQVPHHGSRHSLLDGFYVQVAPLAAVVSTGYANTWGFPMPQVREALENLAIPLYDTGTQGQIIFRWDAAGQLLPPEKTRPDAD